MHSLKQPGNSMAAPGSRKDLTDEQLFRKAKQMQRREVKEQERSMRQALIEESNQRDDSKHVNLFQAE